MKNLIEMLNTHNKRVASGDINFKPNNRLKGLCAYCDEPIASYGRNKINCEYHWLKAKYNSIKRVCVNGSSYMKGEKNLYYEGIHCNMSWRAFIVWCHENDNYKRLNDPALLRIDKNGNYETSNIRWGEMKEIFNSARRKS